LKLQIFQEVPYEQKFSFSSIFTFTVVELSPVIAFSIFYLTPISLVSTLKLHYWC
jgi:hypothetical protein